MAMKMIAGMGGMFGAACWMEKLFSSSILFKYVPSLMQPSTLLAGAVSKLVVCPFDIRSYETYR